MPQRSVLLALVGTEHLGWAGLRATMQSLRTATLVAEASTEQEALRLAAGLHPDAIVLGTGLDTGSPMLLAAELRRCCATAKLVAFGELPAPDDVERYLAIGISAYLLWGSLTPSRLHDLLALLVETDVALLSGAVVRLLGEPGRTRGRQGGEPISISRREQAVLQFLAAGYTRRQIAAAEGISLRSVERIVSDLEAALHASSPFVLGMKAAQLGLVPVDEPAPSQPPADRRRRLPA
jgi:DNA-binding NarL/FixJ family response regulator